MLEAYCAGKCQSLAAVNQIYVFHEAMNALQLSKDLLKAFKISCFKNVNI